MTALPRGLRWLISYGLDNLDDRTEGFSDFEQGLDWMFRMAGYHRGHYLWGDVPFHYNTCHYIFFYQQSPLLCPHNTLLQYPIILDVGPMVIWHPV
jgi:hypothetical protein